MPKMQTKQILQSDIMLDYIYQKHIEHTTLELFNKKEYSSVKNHDSMENVDKEIQKSYNDIQQYEKMYNKIYEQEYISSLNEQHIQQSITDSTENSEEEMLDLGKLKLTVTLEDVIKNPQYNKDCVSLKVFEEMEAIVDKQAKDFTKVSKKSEANYELHESTKKEVEEIMRTKGMNIFQEKIVESEKAVQEISFEKNKFLKASWFMKIGHYIGLSLRNQYYENFDREIIKALDNNQVYKVLEAQKNGYYLGKNLNNLTMEKLYENLTTSPSGLLNELVQRDVLLSYEQLSLIIFCKEGKELINNEIPENSLYAQTLIQDLLKKENFVFANKNLWLKSLKDKELFLTENNPLFYHDKMLGICEKSELLTVKKVLGDFLQEEDVLNSISKNKLIDKMLLKLDILLGNSVELDHMVLDLPQTAQKIYKSIKEIKFTEGDVKILQDSYQFDYDVIEKRLPEAIIKYLSVDSLHRTTLKNKNGKTSENLLLETLENMLVMKKDVHLSVNQAKISELSVTKRYTDSIRGDIGMPSLFTLKTLQQLKDSGELIDLSNETNEIILETKNVENLTTKPILEVKNLAETVKGVRINQENITGKKLKL